MRTVLFAALMTQALAVGLTAQTQPVLQLAGQPYFGGSMKLHLTGTVGQPALLAYGLNPLTTPLQTGKGPWFIGSLVNLVPLGNIPTGGRIDMPFTMPPLMPALIGIPIVMQGYVPFALSNPTTLPLDDPYFVPAAATVLVSPKPTEIGHFGDRAVVGDLNGDGEPDVVVGAWFEDAGGVNRSGRAYVFWGPSLDVITTLEPPSPKVFGEFGMGLAVADLDQDGIEDLIVGEGTEIPTPPEATGTLYVFAGGSAFPRSPSWQLVSQGSGSAYHLFGRMVVAADLNGDAADDIAVGLPNTPDQQFADAGRIDVYWGPAFSVVSSVFSPDPGQGNSFGTVLAAADVNGDSVMDLIESSGRDDAQGIINVGSVHVFIGPSLALLKTIDNPLPDGFNSRFGNAVSGLDMNDDGMDEVITTDERNHAYIFWSPAFAEFQVINRPPDPVTGTAISTSFGYFVATGDVNADGRNDVVVTEPFASGSKGRVYVALGPYYSVFHTLEDKFSAANSEFGWSVLLEDVDEDGRAELLAGSDAATVSGLTSAGHLTIVDLSP